MVITMIKVIKVIKVITMIKLGAHYFHLSIRVYSVHFLDTLFAR